MIILLEITFEAIGVLVLGLGTALVWFIRNISSIPGFTISRPNPIYLKKGESVIVHSWVWWPPGWKKILYSVDDNNDSDVRYL